MADFYMTQNTKARTVPPDMIPVGAWGGRVRAAMDSYTMAGEAAASVLFGPRIPKGARVLPGSYLLTAALGASVTISVGISGTATKYLAATTCNTANLRTLFDAVANMCVELTAAEEIILTTGGAAGTGLVQVVVFYTLD
jgi:hypothetical protein